MEAITVHPGQLLVIYTQGVRTATQLQFVKGCISDALKDLKGISYILCNIENLPKIDVVEREDIQPDQTIRQHYFIQL